MHLHLKSEIPLENIIRHNFTRVRTMFEIETITATISTIILRDSNCETDKRIIVTRWKSVGSGSHSAATCQSRAHLRVHGTGTFHALMIMTRNLDEGQTGFTLGILKRAGDLLPPLRARCAHVLIRCIPEDDDDDYDYDDEEQTNSRAEVSTFAGESRSSRGHISPRKWANPPPSTIIQASGTRKTRNKPTIPS